MQKTKNEHTVSRFYLENFASNGQLYVFDKVTQKSFLSPTQDISTERYFYDFPQTPEQDKVSPQIIEDTLQKMENDFKRDMDELLATLDSGGIVSNQLRESVACFLAIQAARTRESRKMVVEFYEKMNQKLLESQIAMNFPELMPKDFQFRLKPEGKSLAHAQHLLDPERIKKTRLVLAQHIWIFGVNKTAFPLYTSDNPFIRKAHQKHRFFCCTGIASPGIEIAFPLSSRYLLILLERSHFKHMEKFDGQKINLSQEQVTYYNCLQVYGSDRQIYCNSDSFDFSRALCAKHPAVCDSSRERVRVD